jgi:hypothetical protein
MFNVFGSCNTNNGLRVERRDHDVVSRRHRFNKRKSIRCERAGARGRKLRPACMLIHRYVFVQSSDDVWVDG